MDYFQGGMRLSSFLAKDLLMLPTSIIGSNMIPKFIAPYGRGRLTSVISIFYAQKTKKTTDDHPVKVENFDLKLTFCIVSLCIGFMFLSRFVTYSTNVYKMSKLVALDFEVFGTVQGVFFRKHTQKKGQELGLKGWCMNTDKGTVVGQLEGEEKKVEEMKRWLQYTGSPQSAIDKAVFQNEKEISSPSFPSFDIRK